MPASAAGARATRPRIDLRAFQRLTELADHVVPFTIRAVAELGVADALADGPRPVEWLAERTGAHAPSLYRALRALACKGLFTELEPRVFALTPPAELLRSDHPLSLRDAYLPMPADVAAWGELRYSLETGAPAFDRVHGRGLWEHLAAHPDESARFDAGMQAMTRAELRAVAAAYPWGSLRTLVDVGGGNGAFLAGLLARHPALRGVLFDLPHVVAGAPAVLAAAGVGDRCTVVAGSFFEAVPPGGETTYLLKRIVYGWEDARARELLARVRAAMAPGDRVLLIEPLVAEQEASTLGPLLDLVMLVVDGGRARTPAELGALLESAGLELTRTIPTLTFPIVEARAA